MGWEQENQTLVRLNLILAKETQILDLLKGFNVSSITQSLSKLQTGQANLSTAVGQLASAITTLGNTVSTMAANQATCCTEIEAQLTQILKILVPPPAVSFKAVITKQGEEMATAKATADLQVQDNGTFTVVLFFLDALGVQTAAPAGLSASYTASDANPGPSALNLTPSADTSSAAGSINQTTIQALVAAGTALPTGLSVSVTATWTGLASPLTVVASPLIDVVAGPAASFIAQDSTP